MRLEFDPAQHRYTLDGVELPGVSRILDAFGFTTPYPEGEYKIRGTNVHRASVLVDQNKTIRLGSAIEPYVCAYRAFKKDFDVKWVEMERPIYHRQLLYAGRDWVFICAAA